MLGGLTPMGDTEVAFGQPQTISTGANQSVITLPANQRQQNTSPAGFAPPQPPPTDYMAMVKKYAPYVIGAAVLYYLILKNK